MSKQKHHVGHLSDMSDICFRLRLSDQGFTRLDKKIDKLYMQVAVKPMSDMSDKCPTRPQQTKETTVSEHYVICHTCRTPNGRTPKRWQWLCVDCAEDHADTHRRQHPSHDIELRVTHEPTMANLQADMRTLRLTQKRGGW